MAQGNRCGKNASAGTACEASPDCFCVGSDVLSPALSQSAYPRQTKAMIDAEADPGISAARDRGAQVTHLGLSRILVFIRLGVVLSGVEEHSLTPWHVGVRRSLIWPTLSTAIGGLDRVSHRFQHSIASRGKVLDVLAQP